MTSAQPLRHVEILLVEDNDGDARLAMEALRDATFTHQLHHVRDGDEAMDFLHRRGRHAGARRPGLILLDLNLPRKNGREVLSEIKSDARLRRIPVVILSASSAEEDIARSHELHANCYVVKPLDLERFLEVTRSIVTFWLSTVALPAVEADG